MKMDGHRIIQGGHGGPPLHRRARMEAAAEQAASVQARGRRQDFLQRAIANAKKIYDAPSSHCGGVCAIAHLAETGRPRSKKTCPAF